MRVVNSLANSFNPVQSASVLQTIAPTLLDPFVMVAENKAWHGGDLMPAQSPYGPQKPDSERAWRNTSPVFKAIAQGANKLTGGDKYESGWASISPETIELAWENGMGSMGRFLTNTLSLPLSAGKGEVDPSKVPFLRTVYSSWDDRAISSRYREALEKAEVANLRMKGAKSLAERRAVFMSPEHRIYRESRAADKQVKRLSEHLREAETNGSKTMVDLLRKRIVMLQSSVLKRHEL